MKNLLVISLLAIMSLCPSRLLSQPKTFPDSDPSFRLSVKNPFENLKSHFNFFSARTRPDIGMANQGILSSGMDNKQKLDSVVSEMHDDFSGNWQPEGREEYFYDNQGRQVEFIYSIWDSENNDWLEYMKEHSGYDNNGNLILYQFSEWDENSQDWSFSEKSEFSFEGGMMMQEKDYYWNMEEGEWELSGIADYDYQEGLLAQVLIHGTDINGDGIINDLDQVKISYSYDHSGNMIREIYYMYPDMQTGWVAIIKSEFTYNSSNQLESETVYYSDDEGGWLKASLEQYAYDSEGRLISDTYSWWDDEGGRWETSEKWEYNFNQEGDLIAMTLYESDYETGNLVPNIRNEYTIDSRFSFDDLVLPKDYPPEYFNHMLTTYTQFEYDGNEWQMTSRGDIFYSAFTSSGINDLLVNGFIIYPNPADDMVNIRINNNNRETQFEVYDIKGAKVLGSNLVNSGQVSVRDLDPGIYYYRLTESGITRSGRLIVR